MNSTGPKERQPGTSPQVGPTVIAPWYPMPAPAYSISVDSNDDALHSCTLHLDVSTILAGDVLTGHISVDFAAERLSSLTVELYGTATTIVYPKGFGQTPVKSVKTFLKLAPPQPLWTSASAIKPFPLSRCSIPFRLVLPLDLPPSFADGGKSREGMTMGLSAKIEYILVVRGGRRSFFRTGLWVQKPISIVKAAASVEDVSVKALVVAKPWTGAWRVLNTDMALPLGAHARAELLVPDLVACPSHVPLPYQLRITVQSAVLPSSHHTVADLPEAPMDPARLRLQLIRRLDVEGDFQKAHILSSRPLGGFGSTSSRASIRAKVAAPAFVPSSLDHLSGTWQRVVHYEGSLTFADTPSFSSQSVSVSHLIHLHIPIPGTTAVLAADWDIIVSSGVEVAPPAFDFSTAVPTTPHPLPEYTRFG